MAYMIMIELPIPGALAEYTLEEYDGVVYPVKEMCEREIDRAVRSGYLVNRSDAIIKEVEFDA